MKQYAMVIDTRLCVGCGACVIACKTENQVPEGLHRDWVVEETSGRYPDLRLEIRSERCNHCLRPPCVSACPTGASHRDEESNLVLVDSNRCTGCKACMAACPYAVRYVHPRGYVDKCTFCNQRLASGLEPACVAVCPAHAMSFGNLHNPLSRVSRLMRGRAAKTLVPEAGTSPQVFYLL